MNTVTLADIRMSESRCVTGWLPGTRRMLSHMEVRIRDVSPELAEAMRGFARPAPAAGST